MLVKDLMTKNVIVINPYATIKEVALLMSQNNVGCLLVAKNKKAMGIITERDLLKRVFATDVNVEFLRVMDIMTADITTVEKDKDVDYAIDLMIKKNIKKLPVLSTGKLVGIITATDILKAKSEAIGEHVKRFLFKEK